MIDIYQMGNKIRGFELSTLVIGSNLNKQFVHRW